MSERRSQSAMRCRWPAVAVIALVLLYGGGVITGAHWLLAHNHPQSAIHDEHEGPHAHGSEEQPVQHDERPPTTPHQQCDTCMMLASIRADVPDVPSLDWLSDSTHHLSTPIEPLVLERLPYLTISARGPPAV